jgi:hypothetical protein
MSLHGWIQARLSPVGFYPGSYRLIKIPVIKISLGREENHGDTLEAARGI